VSKWSLSPPPYCCWDPAPSNQPYVTLDSVVFCCVPSRCGLPGNEAVVAAAKAVAMHGPFASDTDLGPDVCSCFRLAILLSWQAEWVNVLGKKLSVVKPFFMSGNSPSKQSGRTKSPSHVTVSGTQAWGTGTFGEDGRLRSVTPMVSAYLWHISWWSALVSPKPAISGILMAYSPTYSAIIRFGFQMCWSL
jgi:hypothetical protein